MNIQFFSYDMGDKRGGARIGAGRKPKADEIALIERLSPMDDTALEVLKLKIEEGDMAALKLFFEYRYGKPKQDMNLNGNLGIVWQELKTYEAD